MKLHCTLSSGCPFTPFTFTIQPIHRCHSLRVFVHCGGDVEAFITLSGRFRWLSEVSGCDLFSLMSLPAPPTVHQHVDSRVALTTLPAARGVSRGVHRVGKGAVLELRLQSCVYKHCTHKLLQDIFKKVLVSDFTPSNPMSKHNCDPRTVRESRAHHRWWTAGYSSSTKKGFIAR